MRPLTLVLICGCALAACKGGEAAPEQSSNWPTFEQPATATAARAPLPTACSLLTATDAQAVLGEEAGLMSDDPENCMWASSPQPGVITMLMVQVSDNDDLAMAQEVFNGIVGMPGKLAGMVNEQAGEKTKKSGREIDDLGDEAWLSAASFGGGFGPHQVGGQQLVVRKGTRLLTLNVTGSSKADRLAPRLEALARSAVEKL